MTMISPSNSLLGNVNKDFIGKYCTYGDYGRETKKTRRFCGKIIKELYMGKATLLMVDRLRTRTNTLPKPFGLSGACLSQ